MADEPITKAEAGGKPSGDPDPQSEPVARAVHPPIPVIVIAGPTASGKSALALDIARRLPSHIVNADSMQVYRDLPILTAQPDAADRERVPHRLYGFIGLDDRMDAQHWAELAAREATLAWQRGRLPLLVGGSGLYLRALISGFAPIPDIPPEIRATAKALMLEMGPQNFHERLARLDPRSAAKLRPQDRQRQERAWSVFVTTGRSLIDWQKEEPRSPLPGGRYRVFIAMPPRAELYRACDARFYRMVEQGALDEVAAALAAYPMPERQGGGFAALGFRELAAHLTGAHDLEAAVAAAQQATRNYAKRQVTWFRHQLQDVHFISPDMENMKFSERLITEYCQNIRDFLLTLKN